jgi:hypothetical protein
MDPGDRHRSLRTTRLELVPAPPAVIEPVLCGDAAAGTILNVASPLDGGRGPATGSEKRG